MEILICLSSALIGGLLMSRIAKLLRLPAVTAYLVAGLLLGPFGIGALRFGDIGFPSMGTVGNLHRENCVFEKERTQQEGYLGSRASV